MFFKDYKAAFDEKRSKLRFEPGTIQKGPGCETKVKPQLPTWLLDWAVLYPDGFHFRVKEYYKPKLHPAYNQGYRVQFSYQYGATTATDAKGMPRTASDRDTIIRIDLDQWGPHLNYAGINHIQQEALTGAFKIMDSEVFAFVEAVETCRQSHCTMQEILFFELDKAGVK